MAELDRLIGLANIKDEVRTLANFLKVQAKRKEAGLPTTELSLHMVFGGNPGTGKTTVARIVGKIFGAMGVLDKGHLIETDRSGLVAEYAGQTGPKTQKKIDEALDGVLFIDEAYTLIAAEGDDPYGHEAVQTLLKRMEDDRERLVVILAGYPVEMVALLRSNPGLSSRFSRQLDFVDYTPLELVQIFGQMCAEEPVPRRRRSAGQDDRRPHLAARPSRPPLRQRPHGAEPVRGRDPPPGQPHRGASRSCPSSSSQTLEPDDVAFADCPPEALAPLADDKLRFHIECPQCDHGKDVPQKFLGADALSAPSARKSSPPNGENSLRNRPARNRPSKIPAKGGSPTTKPVQHPEQMGGGHERFESFAVYVSSHFFRRRKKRAPLPSARWMISPRASTIGPRGPAQCPTPSRRSSSRCPAASRSYMQVQSFGSGASANMFVFNRGPVGGRLHRRRRHRDRNGRHDRKRSLGAGASPGVRDECRSDSRTVAVDQAKLQHCPRRRLANDPICDRNRRSYVRPGFGDLCEYDERRGGPAAAAQHRRGQSRFAGGRDVAG